MQVKKHKSQEVLMEKRVDVETLYQKYSQRDIKLEYFILEEYSKAFSKQSN